MFSRLLFLSMFLASLSFAGESLTTAFSASVRLPKDKVRVVSGDTLSNPLDYELCTRVDRKVGKWRTQAEITFERQDGIHYVGQEYKSEFDGESIGFAWRLLRVEEHGDIYVQSVHLEKRFLRVFGTGLTRQWTSEWFSAGEWMARTSLQIPPDMAGGFELRAVHEFNQSRSRQYVYLSYLGKLRGNVDIRPFLKHERIDPRGGEVRVSFQAKVELVVRL